MYRTGREKKDKVSICNLNSWIMDLVWRQSRTCCFVDDRAKSQGTTRSWKTRRSKTWKSQLKTTRLVKVSRNRFTGCPLPRGITMFQRWTNVWQEFKCSAESFKSGAGGRSWWMTAVEQMTVAGNLIPQLYLQESTKVALTPFLLSIMF